MGETLAGAGTQLCVSVSVRDAAALLDAVGGGEPGDPYGAPPGPGSFLACAERDPPRLRIALQRAPVEGPAPEPALVRAVEEAARLLEGLGHAVEEAGPPASFAEIEQALFTVMAGNTWANLVNSAAGRPFGEGDFEPVTWAYATAGRETGAAEYIRAVQAFHRIGRQVGAFFARYDVLLTPTLARAALPLGTIRTDGPLDAFRAATAQMIAFTALHNLAGTPAASLPLAWTDEGLPLGIQIAARFGDEATLVALSAQLERARPWRDRRPPLAA
jgi:amidase